MQKQTDFQIRKFLVPIFFTVFTLFYLCNCATPAALKFAGKRAEETINYMNVKEVRTATKQKNGDILVGVDLAPLTDFKKVECYTIVLPISSLAKGDAAKNVKDKKDILKPKNLIKDYVDRTHYGFIDVSKASNAVSSVDFYSYPNSWKFYMYPIEKAKRGCQGISSDRFSTSESLVPIEKVNVINTFESYTELVKELPQDEIIYEVRIFSAEQGTANASNSQELMNKRAREAIEVVFIYWPSQTSQELEGILPIGIAGAYQVEDDGTKFGYLLVPPAFVLDIFIVIGHIIGPGF